ncbi:alpha/beta fold hydrolase [Pseudomonas sp. JM0905a]|uniref:Lysophospholipase n=1 Tax=Metapseudomonas resinovorans TaxID=53412 RepID=A0ABT4YAS2_METRE|nr:MULTISPECIES: alpha/beta fold hydrolase [Pseudomonas]MBD2839106.1 alpha/beta fold hydrolase [Pseudomonas sp. JM0905a]MDA8485955.1 lysophospholipase [Pseudomonas resinovorans]
MLRLFLLLLPLLAGLAQAAPQSVLQRPVELDTGNGILRGTLLRPKTDQPVPVALIIAGSGPTDRDGNNAIGGRNDSLKKLAQLLARNGIASVRYDKRGIAASRDAATDERQLSIELYTRDAAAWGQSLKQDPRFSQLILIGHSEGALIASLAANAAGADALISISGSARPIDQLLRDQLQNRLPPPLLTQSEALLASLRAGQEVAEVPQALEALFRPSVQPYLISLFRQDPAQAFGRLRIPALILQGSSDIQVSVSDAEQLKAARPDAELVIIEGMNHMLRIVPMDMEQQLASYRNPQLPLAQELGTHILAFIKGLPDSRNAGIGR